MPLSEEIRSDLERILKNLKETQTLMCNDDGTAVAEMEDQEGYVGEAICAVGMALGRHVP